MTRKDLFEHDHKHLKTFMMEKIEENTYKGVWENLDTFNLLMMMIQEVEELKDSVAQEGDDAICRECADVANFCMMIVGNIQRKKEVNKVSHRRK